jgi:hypothetical protein
MGGCRNSICAESGQQHQQCSVFCCKLVCYMLIICVLQGLADMKKTPDLISPNMTSGVRCNRLALGSWLAAD